MNSDNNINENIKNLKNIFYRCESCQYIPLYGIKYKKNKIYLEYLCQNRHYSINKFKKKLDEIYNNNNYELNYIDKYKNLYSKEKIYICSKCNHIFSEKYNKSEFNNAKHNLINYNIIDNSCPKHSLNVYGYCKTCYTNFCQHEIMIHKKHKITLIENFIINEEIINEYNKNIKESEIFLKKINNIYFKIINEIKRYLNDLKKIYQNYIEINSKEIIFCKNLINTYDKIPLRQIGNYEIIQNLKNICNFNKYDNIIEKFLKMNYKNFENINCFYNFISNNKNCILKESSLNLIEINEKKSKKLIKFKEKQRIYKNSLEQIKKFQNIKENLQLNYPKIYFHKKIFSISIDKEILNNLNYIGNIKHNRLNGFGLYKKNNLIYEGYFTDNIINGIGKISEYCPEQEEFIIYKGEINNYLMNGYGILISKKIEMEGEFFMGKKKGLFIITKEDGTIYLSQFKNDYLHGIGVVKINEYEKIYREIDKGKIVYSIYEECYDDNNYYLGEYSFYNNKYIPQGFGQLRDKYGFYEGFFNNGLKEGYGEFLFYDGSFYKGNFKNNLMEGKGLLKYNNGDIFKGTFKKNKKHGFGIYQYKNGNIKKDKWIDDYTDDERKFINSK